MDRIPCNMSHEDDDDDYVNNNNCKVVRVHAMKTYVGVVLQLHSFLASAVSGGEYFASFTPSCFMSGEKPSVPSQ
jgi:hypothetical protein